MAESSWMADLYSSMGDAVADIRQKVIEEGYFGRAVTQLDVSAPECDCPWPETRGAEQQQPEPEQQQEHAQGMDL